ncbi:MAG: glucose-1-phosphate thymidylyltransferase [Myxococcota bacterium]|nr:glucose-1-phosphate thymidylyltransferase [Myxococcota bacterium]
MKALILAGGKGSRLRPLTATRSKQLLPVAGRPLLHYAVQAVRDAGCHEIGVIVGDTGPEIQAALGDGSAFGVSITLLHQPEPLGLAHALLVAEPFLGAQPFLMFLGDNLLQGAIAPFLQRHVRDGNAATLLLARVPDPQRFGVVEVSGERVTRLVEKPQNPASDLALTGIYLLDSRIFSAARAIAPSPRGELEITDALQVLVDRGEPVIGLPVQGWWKDTGKPEDLLAANRLLLQQPTPAAPAHPDIPPTNEDRLGVTVHPPCWLGPGVHLERCELGPFASIGAGCSVVDARVSDSIVMDHARLESVHLQGSLIGQGARVRGAGPEGPPARLHLGDQSVVELPCGS